MALLARPGARLVAHRSGRRATVALPRAFAKAVPPGRLPAILAATARVAAVPGGPLVAPLVAVDHEAGVVVHAAFAGRSLSARPELAASAAPPLRALHRHGAGGGRAHDAAAEAAVLRGWLARVRPFDAAVYDAVAATAEQTAARLDALAPAPTGTIHADLHDKQLFPSAGRLGVIDLDTVRAGDPAVDVANLVVHLELRALQGRLPAAAAARAARDFLRRYGEVDRERLDLYRAATWLRLACVYAFRPAWQGLAPLLAARARPASDRSRSRR